MNKCIILGLDIGGANTKAAFIHFERDKIAGSPLRMLFKV